MAKKFAGVSVLFCCMGNICRSPTAEGVFRQHVASAGLEDRIRVDSAGTHDYHVGHPPDQRAQEAARLRGYDLAPLRARQVTESDFSGFDYILAMDGDNLAHLQRIAPPRHRDKARLYMDFGARHKGMDVPDPYYGGDAGFALVLDMVEDGASGLLAEIRKKLGS